MKKKSYCGDLFCHMNDRKIKCDDCGVYVCNVCSAENKCIDCYIKNNFKSFVHEFEDMIYTLNIKDSNIHPTLTKETLCKDEKEMNEGIKKHSKVAPIS